MKVSKLLILTFILFSLSISAQSVFAPVVGAEWNYYFISTNYNDPPPLPPLTKAEYGIINYKYIKDTLINSFIFKKIEVRESSKTKGDDNIYNKILPPLFMMQRNDSIFTFVNEKFFLSFKYSKDLNTKVSIISPYSSFNSTLELTDTSSYFSLNQSTLKFKKYIYKVTTSAIDIDLINPLSICDRIGPLNSDITHITSQGRTPSNGGRKYRLNCYRDDKIGEVKFVTTECFLLSKIHDIDTKNNLTICFRKPLLEVKIENDENQDLIKSITLVDISGKTMTITENIQNPSAIIKLSDLPSGLYVVQVQTANNYFISKKIVNY